MRVVFVGGVSRSGSTLVERLLGEIPGVCPVGEIRNLWDRGLAADEPCGCGRRFSGCDFWTSIGDTAFGGWQNVDLTRVLALKRTVERLRLVPVLARSRLSASRFAAVSEYAGYYTRVYAAAATLTGSPVVVDSSKSAPLVYALRWAADLDLRVVHLVRDPRGVSLSQLKHRARLPGHDPDVLMHRYPPARTALEWSLFNAPFDVLGRLPGGHGAVGRPVPVAVRRLRYEDLLADPRAAVGELAGFAGLRLDPDDLEYLADDHVDLGAVHNAAGNPMRFARGRIQLRVDQTWRSELSRRHRWLVGAACAPLMTAYGYPLVMPPPSAGPTVDPPVGPVPGRSAASGGRSAASGGRSAASGGRSAASGGRSAASGGRQPADRLGVVAEDLRRDRHDPAALRQRTAELHPVPPAQAGDVGGDEVGSLRTEHVEPGVGQPGGE